MRLDFNNLRDLKFGDMGEFTGHLVVLLIKI